MRMRWYELLRTTFACILKIIALKLVYLLALYEAVSIYSIMLESTVVINDKRNALYVPNYCPSQNMYVIQSVPLNTQPQNNHVERYKNEIRYRSVSL
jgi:hypothetical protein